MNFALKFQRIRLGIKQKDLADKVGITQQYLSEIENGKAINPSKAVMDKLGTALGSTVYELFYEEEA
jgi:putative transcriptional regulator